MFQFSIGDAGEGGVGKTTAGFYLSFNSLLEMHKKLLNASTWRVESRFNSLLEMLSGPTCPLSWPPPPVSILYWRCVAERVFSTAKELGNVFQFSIGDAGYAVPVEIRVVKAPVSILYWRCTERFIRELCLPCDEEVSILYWRCSQLQPSPRSSYS